MSKVVSGFVMMVLCLAVAGVDAALDTASVPWVPLYNGRDLTNWYLYPDQQWGSKAENGMLHMIPSGGMGCLFSVDALSVYDYRFEYKWNGGTDSGYMIHCQNDGGSAWPKSCWPTSIEFQVCTNMGGWATGDIWCVGTNGMMKTPGRDSSFNWGGMAGASQNYEKPGWNVCVGLIRAKAGTYVVNGSVNNAYSGLSVDRGRIGMQFEFGEIYYRNLEVRKYDSPFGAITTCSATQAIDAAKRDNYVGLLKTEASSEGGGGQMVTSLRSDDWLTFYRVDFGASSPPRFFAHCKTTGDSNKVHVLVDGPSGASGSGKEIGVVTAPKGSLATVDCALASSVTGTHQVYLRLDNGVSLTWFQFGSSASAIADRGRSARQPVAAEVRAVGGQVVFSVPQALGREARLRICEPSGRLVRELASGRQGRSSGPSMLWDGRGNGGIRVRPGTYVYSIDVDGETLSGACALR